ncbi:MAG: hypothetical protein L0212_02240 [Acidobacteria bacterium]|nr:hypothetical protein [Acidobacteriota bacterium]
MSKRNVFLIVLALMIALATAPAFAQGKSKGKGSGSSSDKGKEKSAHAEKDKDKGKSSHHRAWDNEPGPDKRPAGWDQGKKEGWGDCDVPPGLAKKRGCDESGLSARERAAKARKKGKVEDKVKSASKSKDKSRDAKKASSSATETKKQPSTTTVTSKTTVGSNRVGERKDTRKAESHRER